MQIWNYLLSPVNEVCDKVLFSQACVILSRGEGVGLCCRDSSLQRPPSPVHLMATTTTGGTHHTGMHSCSYLCVWSTGIKEDLAVWRKKNHGTWLHFHDTLFCILLQVPIQYFAVYKQNFKTVIRETSCTFIESTVKERRNAWSQRRVSIYVKTLSESQVALVIFHVYFPSISQQKHLSEVRKKCIVNFFHHSYYEPLWKAWVMREAFWHYHFPRGGLQIFVRILTLRSFERC